MDPIFLLQTASAVPAERPRPQLRQQDRRHGHHSRVPRSSRSAAPEERSRSTYSLIHIPTQTLQKPCWVAWQGAP